jgi:TatD DNase family protein
VNGGNQESPMFIDTHAHLDDEAFQSDIAQVIERARDGGVTQILNAGSTLVANQRIIELLGSGILRWGALGLHPHEFNQPLAWDEHHLAAQLAQEGIVALGEIGLDFHLFPGAPAPDREQQLKGFARQLALAKTMELPVIVHVREAFGEALETLRSAGLARGGVIHCFSGDRKWMEKFLELGYHIGISGMVTYPKADDLREAVAACPVDRLVLETDCPYLPPQSRRGQRNEPVYVAEIARYVAQLRGIEPAELGRVTTANAERLFKMGSGHPGTLVYPIDRNLYVNLTNRCTARCVFCPREYNRRVRGHELSLQREPRASEIIAAIPHPQEYAEIVFCGFGEPTLRYPTLLDAARQLKARGARIRVNTNGHALGLFAADLLAQARQWVDTWSISLNAPSPEAYAASVRPQAPDLGFQAVLDFIREAVSQGGKVIVSCVEHHGADCAAVEKIVTGLGAIYRARPLDRLGEPERQR